MGTGIRTAAVASAGTITFEPKDATRANIAELCDDSMREQSLSLGEASKLRGAQGWLASNSFGRVGRVARPQLKKIQSCESGESCMNEQREEYLKIIRYMSYVIPPRVVHLRASHQPPLYAYSDAEFTPGRPHRLGWIAFESDRSVVLAGSSVVERSQLHLLLESEAPPAVREHRATLCNLAGIFSTGPNMQVCCLIAGSIPTDRRRLEDRIQQHAASYRLTRTFSMGPHVRFGALIARLICYSVSFISRRCTFC